MSVRRETELEMARRHVREGEERVMRQVGIVLELEIDNHPKAAALGRKLPPATVSLG